MASAKSKRVATSPSRQEFVDSYSGRKFKLTEAGQAKAYSHHRRLHPLEGAGVSRRWAQSWAGVHLIQTGSDKAWTILVTGYAVPFQILPKDIVAL